MTTPAPGCKPKANQAAKKERGTIFLGGPANLKSAEGPVTGQMRLQEAYTIPVYRALHRGNRPASGASEAKHIKFHTIKRIRALRSYDFGAALAVLKGNDKQSVHGLGSPVTPNGLSRPVPDRSRTPP